MKNILVLGGAGYIGSVVVEDLLNKNYNVIVFDNLTKGHKEAVDTTKCTLIEGDIANKELLNAVMQEHKIDAVMHFCALSIVPDSMRDPSSYFRNNVVNALNILDCMVENKVKKIIFSSTAAVYGEPAKVPIEETDKTSPTNPYGESKLIFEKLIKWYSQIHGISYVCLRYFNACGATKIHGEDHSPETHLIPIILEAALGKRESIKLFGADYATKDGTCVRDYIHVLDLASAHLLALEHPENGTFNLGSGSGYSVSEVIDAVKKITGKNIKVEVLSRRVGDPAVLIAASNLARTKLNWKPKYGLNDIISSAYEWHSKNPTGYAR